MNDFIELDKPVHHCAFGWFVMPLVPKGDIKFLATDGTLKVRDRVAGFFFKTELDAHHAAISYYNYYGVLYPHTGEMIVSALPVNESQVMVFK